MGATAPVQAREATVLGLSGSGESESNGRNLLMQTEPCNSSIWGYAEYIPVIPFHSFLTVYSFQGPTNWESFGLFFPQIGFGRCFCSSPKHVLLFPEQKKWRLLTPQQQTAPSAENGVLFSEANLSCDIPSEV